MVYTQAMNRIKNREFPRTLLIMGVVLAARSSLADQYTVPTGSMEHTIQPGDRIMVDKMAFGLRVPFTDWRLTSGRPPQRGEVVVFDSPEDGLRLVKRLVAVEGDVVEVIHGHLRINGKPVAEGVDTERFGERVAHLNLRHGGGPDAGPWRIPAGMALVMGDARGNSHDGRMFGPVRLDHIQGRGLAVIWRDGPVWQPL